MHYSTNINSTHVVMDLVFRSKVAIGIQSLSRITIPKVTQSVFVATRTLNTPISTFLSASFYGNPVGGLFRLFHIPSQLEITNVLYIMPNKYY